MSYEEEQHICREYGLDSLYTVQIQRFADGAHNFYSSMKQLYSQITPEHTVQLKEILGDALEKTPEWSKFLLTTDFDDAQRGKVLEFLTDKVHRAAEDNLRQRHLLE